LFSLNAPSAKNVDGPVLVPVTKTLESEFLAKALSPTIWTDAGIVTDVRPSLLNAPWSIVTNPDDGKLIPITFLLSVSGFGENAFEATFWIPDGIVATPLQFTPAAEGIVTGEFTELT
jgi:hypothetical protein